ncbi:MAG: tetratricopeptide repeat protein [Planctomycetota bacterium]
MPRSAFVLAAAFLAAAAIFVAYYIVPVALDRRPAPPPAAGGAPAQQGRTPAPAPAVSSAPAPLPAPTRKEASKAPVPVDESIETLFERARRLAEETRDYKGAIALFKQVVARQAEERALAARALYEIGRCLEQMGRPDEAQEAFEKTLELYADQREAADAARRRLPADKQASLDADDELRKRIQEGRVDLDFVGMPFTDVVSLLREETRLNIIVDQSEPSEGFEKEITVRLWNATIAEALDRVASEASATWVVTQGCVLFRPAGCVWRPEADKPPVLPAWEADVPAWKKEEEAMRTALSLTPASLSLENAGLADLSRAFQASTGRLIVVDDPVAQDTEDKRITFMVRELDPSQSLDLICRMLELSWYVDRGTIHITTEEAAEAWRKEHP